LHQIFKYKFYTTMKELLKHLPTIQKFVEEKTQDLQELTENTVKTVLKEAYNMPMMFPIRILIKEDKFTNFLFDMRKELFGDRKVTKDEEMKIDFSEKIEEPIKKIVEPAIKKSQPKKVQAKKPAIEIKAKKVVAKSEKEKVSSPKTIVKTSPVVKKIISKKKETV
jgi:hypothetical protein